ncbi:MAG: ABC transporter permease [Deltaproteobacteria bacterium]|nr:ABC transporter permease [Deltaproteobacteria bacterium]
MRLHDISLHHLERRKSKMLFLVAGLTIGMATIVALLSVVDSMTRDVEDRLDRFGANIVMVPKSENLSLSYGGLNVGGVSYKTGEFSEEKLKDLKTIENSRNLGVIAPKVLGTLVLKGTQVLVMGVDLESEYSLKTWWRINGRLPERNDELLAGSDAASALPLTVGEKVTLGAQDFTVTGILESTGTADDGVLIGDLKRMQTLLGKEGKISLVEIAAFCRGCPIAEIVLQIAEKFPEAKVTALEQVVLSKMQSIDLIRSFSYGVAALIMVIGSLLVFVTMMGSVNERTREIGIFRAIGFRRGHVMQIILLEAMGIGFISGLLGYLAGSVTAWGIMPWVTGGQFAGWQASTGVMSVLLGVSLSLLAGLYPAWKASDLDPSVALRAL